MKQARHYHVIKDKKELAALMSGARQEIVDATSIERTPDAKGSHRKRAMPIGYEQISVVIDGRSIVEAYTKRRLLHDFVIRHRQPDFILQGLWKPVGDETRWTETHAFSANPSFLTIGDQIVSDAKPKT